MRRLHGNHDHGPGPAPKPTPTPLPIGRYTLRDLDTGETRRIELTPLEEAPADHGMPYPDDSHAHPGDPDKALEHLAKLKLVPPQQATHVAVKSGGCDDPSTWWGGIPKAGGMVWIPKGVSVDWCCDLPGLKWLRNDGTFTLCDGIHLQVVTVVSTDGSHFKSESGDWRITILDRGERDRVYDPLDLSGGLILHGKTDLIGREIAETAIPSVVPKAGDTTIQFDALPKGWIVGGRVIVAGVDLAPPEWVTDLREYRTIAGIDGATITLDKPLEFDGHGGLEKRPQALPVIYRDLAGVVESEVKDDITRRGHVMQMHSQHCRIKHVAFRGLGRTDTLYDHTVPQLNAAGNLIEGTDKNAIGRYAVHLHGVTGAKRDSVPAEIVGCIVEDSPKHGFVNHGMNANIDDCVAVDCLGSGFFGENGSEIGRFKNWLAIGCRNPTVMGDAGGRVLIKPIKDFGHDGNGLWIQGGMVDVIGGLAIACDTGLAFYPEEIGDGVGDIPVSNLKPEHQAQLDPSQTTIKLHNVPGYFSGNDSLGCEQAVMFWAVNLFEPHPENPFWTVYRNGINLGCGNGIHGRYSKFVKVLDSTFISRSVKPLANSAVLFQINEPTKAWHFEGCYMAGFDWGLTTPPEGPNVIRDCFIDTLKPVYVSDPATATVEGNTFGETMLEANPEPVVVKGE